MHAHTKQQVHCACCGRKRCAGGAAGAVVVALALLALTRVSLCQRCAQKVYDAGALTASFGGGLIINTTFAAASQPTPLF